MADPNALIAYLEDRETWTFGYGREPHTHDCVRFCAGGVLAVHGVNPLDRCAREWTTRRGAKRVLASIGGMAAAVSEVMREIAPTLAQRGDVGMTEAGELVLFEGDHVVGLAEHQGYRRRPRSAAIKAWTI